MIDHGQCGHERTPSARAKCRRANGRGKNLPWPRPPLYSLGPPPASKQISWGGKAHHDPDRERNTGQVPRDRENECHVCHVERIAFRGTDPITGILLFVGERCTYMVESQDDFAAVP